jgi:hypothetical protein
MSALKGCQLAAEILAENRERLSRGLKALEVGDWTLSEAAQEQALSILAALTSARFARHNTARGRACRLRASSVLLGQWILPHIHAHMIGLDSGLRPPEN